MTTKSGKDGLLKLGTAPGTNTVGEMQRWTWTQSVDPLVDTSMGDTAETHLAGSGISQWSAEVDVWWDEGDTNGQQACVLGASLIFNFLPEGATTGDVYQTGTGSIVNVTNTTEKNGIITKTFQVKGNGPLAEATVS